MKNFAEVFKPLYQLIEQNRPFKWTKQSQESFEALRRALVSAPVLIFPDCFRMFILPVTMELVECCPRSVMMVKNM